MSDNTLFQIVCINRINLPQDIIRLITEFRFIERKKKMQKYILNIFSECSLITRRERQFETDEHWAIQLKDGIQHQSNNCNVCGNYKMASFYSKHSQNDIEIYSHFDDEEIFLTDSEMLEIRTIEIENLLIKAKIFCLCV